MEIQQSKTYAEYIRSLGWVVEKAGPAHVYIKPFPVIGGLAKIQRTAILPAVSVLVPILKKHRVRTLAIEPDAAMRQSTLSAWIRRMRAHVRINTDYFLPTKTIRVNLKPDESELFRRFTEAKRRAVRKSEKLGTTIVVSDEIDTFLALKNKSAGFLGFITTAGVKKLWNILPGKNRTVLLANAQQSSVPVAGIMLIFWDAGAYYWIAGATKSGKKLFAPTLLVWNAIREAKRRKCKYLDFLGVWDERIPTKNHEWHGFTKFKEGFGGEPLYYPFTQKT